MATRRVILKLKKPFAKGKGSGTGTEMKRYLHRLFPADQKACLYSGGFLLGSPSASPQEETKQRDWIKRMIQKWSAELAGKSRRTNDGFRIILSMVQDAERDLTDSSHSTSQALLEIWEKTIELFRLRHGCGELGWICGGRHDSGSANLKIILFPTTKDGQLLLAGADGDENPLVEIFAMANLAAEIYWRDYLGLAHQDPDYRKTISKVPIYEPPLPSYDSLIRGKAVANSRKNNLEETAKINAALIAPEMLSDTMISLNMGSPLSRPAHKGLIRLKSLVAIRMIFKARSWLISILIGKRTAAQTIEVQEKLPDEYLIIKDLIDELGRSEHLATRRLVGEIAQNEVESTFVALYLAVGTQGQPSNETTLKFGAGLAAGYQDTVKKLPDEKIAVVWNLRGECQVGATKTKLRACSYRNALRVIDSNKTSSRTAHILLTLIRGAERFGHFLDALHAEITMGIDYTGTNGRKNIQKLEWSINNEQMVRRNANGAPWPPQFDPITVFVPLTSSEPMTLEPPPEEAAPSEPVQSSYSAHSGVLNRMIRITQSKEIDRRQRITECILDNRQV